VNCILRLISQGFKRIFFSQVGGGGSQKGIVEEIGSGVFTQVHFVRSKSFEIRLDAAVK